LGKRVKFSVCNERVGKVSRLTIFSVRMAKWFEHESWLFKLFGTNYKNLPIASKISKKNYNLALSSVIFNAFYYQRWILKVNMLVKLNISDCFSPKY
jgi:hypothetical protein